MQDFELVKSGDDFLGASIEVDLQAGFTSFLSSLCLTLFHLFLLNDFLAVKRFITPFFLLLGLLLYIMNGPVEVSEDGILYQGKCEQMDFGGVCCLKGGNTSNEVCQ